MEPCDVAEAEAAPADATPADAEAAERRRAANRKKRARQRAKKAAQKEEAGSPSGHSAADESDDEEDKVPPAESLAAVDLSDPSPDAAAPADDGDPLDDIDFSDSDGDEQEAEPEDISLGFAVEGDRDGLLRNQFASKLGGPPAWLDPVQLPLESELRCAVSGLPLRFLLQVYAPLDDHDERAFHRAIYLFISPCGSRLDQPGAVRAFRTQLPRDNELYPFEPPEPGDQPRALTAPQAAVAKARCKPHAPQEAAVPGAHAHYFEHELVVEPEPEASEAVGASDSDHVNKLVDEYRSKEAPEPGKDEGKDEGKPAKPDTDIFGKTEPEVADFASFTARLARAPEQCLRYTFGSDASPLWTSRARRPPAGAVPACPRCGGRRRFEFQVMPQALHYMDIDSQDAESPDWGTIAVYTCAASCAPTPPLPAAVDGSGAAVLADPPDARAAASAVGTQLRISGLQGRDEFNGQRATLLGWHDESSRWMVALPSGDTVRLRSSNLLLPEGGAGAAQEGGYAEEFVWVQSQGDPVAPST